MEIKLHNGIDPEEINKVLQGYGINNHFVTPANNNAWLEEINHDPTNPQKHLKPKGRELTMDELKKTFPKWTEEGLFEADLNYNRTPVNEIQSIAEFVIDYQMVISYITEAEAMINKGDLKKEFWPILKLMNKPEEEPEKLPPEEQYIPDIQSGILSCKYWGEKKVWLIYGKVDTPRFLKENIFRDACMNNIYKDKNGLAYLLVPLMPLGNSTMDFLERTLQEINLMGVMENPYFVAGNIYSSRIIDLKAVADQFKQDYTAEERLERAKILYNQLEPEGLTLNQKQQYTMVSEGSLYRAKLDLLNAFLLAFSVGEMNRFFIHAA